MIKKILVLAANPKDTPTLRLDQEIREIDNGLERAQKRNEFVLKQKLAVRPVDVRRAMLDYKPNIVHFCGHGSGEEGIALEDENGQVNLIGADALAGFFKLFANEVECVVLNACYSEVQAEAIAKHIPFVIGMRKAIKDNVAIEFAVAFYDALGAGGSVMFAYKLACNAIQWAKEPEYLTPTIKTKLGDSIYEITSRVTAFCYLNKEGIDEICTKFNVRSTEGKYSHKISLLLSQLEKQDLLAFSLIPTEKRFTYVAAKFRLVDDDEMYLAFQAEEDNRIRMNLRKSKSSLWPSSTKIPVLAHVGITLRSGLVEFQVFGEWYSTNYLRPHAVTIAGISDYNNLVDD